jgi:hypothetical protein
MGCRCTRRADKSLTTFRQFAKTLCVRLVRVRRESPASKNSTSYLDRPLLSLRAAYFCAKRRVCAAARGKRLNWMHD